MTGCAAVLLKCSASTLHSWSGIKLAKGETQKNSWPRAAVVGASIFLRTPTAAAGAGKCLITIAGAATAM